MYEPKKANISSDAKKEFFDKAISRGYAVAKNIAGYDESAIIRKPTKDGKIVIRMIPYADNRLGFKHIEVYYHIDIKATFYGATSFLTSVNLVKSPLKSTDLVDLDKLERKVAKIEAEYHKFCEFIHKAQMTNGESLED
jgi:hypothetical protein